MVELLGRHRLLDGDEVGERDHGVVAPAHIDAAHVVGILPVDVGDLHHNIILLAILLEARDLAAAEHGLERAAERVDLDADRRRLVAVHCDVELRRVQPEIGVEIDEAGIVFRLLHQRVDHLLQLFVRTRGLDHDVDRLLARALAERRRIARKGDDAGHGDHVGRDRLGDLLLGAAPLAPWGEPQDDPPLRDGGVAGDREHAVGLRHLQRDLLEFPGVGVAIFDGGAFGPAKHGEDVALVLDRGKLACVRSRSSQASA